MLQDRPGGKNQSSFREGIREYYKPHFRDGLVATTDYLRGNYGKSFRTELTGFSVNAAGCGEPDPPMNIEGACA